VAGLGHALAHALDAPQVGLHARSELDHAEGLGHVFVGTHRETHDLVGIAGLGRQHDDGQGVIPAQLPANLELVDIRHHQVKDQQVQDLAAAGLDGCGTAGDRHDPVAFVFELLLQQEPHVGVVVGDQDSGQLVPALVRLGRGPLL
jgi:hypothetical protein